MSHISEERLKARLTTKELEHIAKCEYCAERFALFCEDQLLPLPLPIKEQIIKKAKIYSPAYRKQQEFKKYCFRVVLSCAGSLALIVSAKAFEREEPIQNNERFIPGIVRYNQTTDEIKEFFTFKEDTNNEKTK